MSHGRGREGITALSLAVGGEEVGPRGLTYDETSLVYSLLWNLPALQPNPHGYSERRVNPLVRRGGQTHVRTTSIGLPLFYTDSPDQPITDSNERGREREGVTEIREMVCGTEFY